LSCLLFFLESEDDVDKIVIKRLDVCDLKHLCGSIVDLAYANVRSRDAIDLGVCIISSPIYVFINREEKLALLPGDPERMSRSFPSDE